MVKLVSLNAMIRDGRNRRPRPSRAHPMKANRQVIEDIRNAYLELPSTTAAGLARRFGVPERDGITAVTGRGLGLQNLARARVLNEKAIQARLGTSGSVKVEPELVRWSGGSAPKRGDKKKPKAPTHAPYESLMGASMRKAKRLYWERRRAAEQAAAGPITKESSHDD